MFNLSLSKLKGVATILVTDPCVPKEAIKLLKQKCKVITCRNEEVLQKCKGIDGLLWANLQPLNAKVLNAAGPQLKVISTISSGVDHVDVAEVMRRKILLGNVVIDIEKTVADVAIGLMISAARRFHEASRSIETSSWKGWRFQWILGRDIRGAKVGFFGFGKVGRAIADRLAGFEIGGIIYNTRTRSPAEGAYKAEHVTFDKLLKDSDILFIVAPLTDETRTKFDESAFSKMKPTAVLVNVGRGQIIDQKALYDALKTNKIFAAGLDVTAPEPLPPDDPLLGLPNCIILPHLGPCTLETERTLAIHAANNILRGLAGEPMLGTVYK